MRQLTLQFSSMLHPVPLTIEARAKNCSVGSSERRRDWRAALGKQLLRGLLIHSCFFVVGVIPADAETKELSDIQKILKDQMAALDEMNQKIKDMEFLHPEFVQRNEEVWNRIKETRKYLEASSERLENGKAEESFNQQARFFSEMSGILIQPLNFMKDDEAAKSPPIGTFLDKEGVKVRYPKERKMTVGKKPFFESQKFEKKEVITHSTQNEEPEEPEQESYLEALSEESKKKFDTKLPTDIEREAPSEPAGTKEGAKIGGGSPNADLKVGEPLMAPVGRIVTDPTGGINPAPTGAQATGEGHIAASGAGIQGASGPSAKGKSAGAGAGAGAGSGDGFVSGSGVIPASEPGSTGWIPGLARNNRGLSEGLARSGNGVAEGLGPSAAENENQIFGKGEGESKGFGLSFGEGKANGFAEEAGSGESQEEEPMPDKELEKPLLKDMETEQEIQQNDELTDTIREWLLQEKLLLDDLRRFKPVRQLSTENPPWEYYLLKQKQLMLRQKQIRRRIEFYGKQDEYFIELEKLSEIANRFLDLLNRGEYTNYEAASHAYDDLIKEIEQTLGVLEVKNPQAFSYRGGEPENVPSSYRAVVSKYFKLLSES